MEELEVEVIAPPAVAPPAAPPVAAAAAAAAAAARTGVIPDEELTAVLARIAGDGAAFDEPDATDPGPRGCAAPKEKAGSAGAEDAPAPVGRIDGDGSGLMVGDGFGAAEETEEEDEDENDAAEADPEAPVTSGLARCSTRWMNTARTTGPVTGSPSKNSPSNSRKEY